MCCLGECRVRRAFRHHRVGYNWRSIPIHKCWPGVPADCCPGGNPASRRSVRQRDSRVLEDLLARFTKSGSTHTALGRASHQLGRTSDQPRGSGTHTTPKQTLLDFQWSWESSLDLGLVSLHATAWCPYSWNVLTEQKTDTHREWRAFISNAHGGRPPLPTGIQQHP